MHALVKVATISLLAASICANPVLSRKDLYPPIDTNKPLTMTFCAPSAPGSCTLAVRWPLPTKKLPYPYHELTLYNSDCRVIGSDSSVPQHPGDFNLYSELPYVVVGNTAWPNFEYAGTKYNDETKGLSGMVNACDEGAGNADTPGDIHVCRFKCMTGH